MFNHNGVVSLRTHSALTQSRAARPARPLADTLRQVWATLATAIEVMATRRHLAEVDDRTLQDLGISRAQAKFEASRAPWDLTSQRR